MRTSPDQTNMLRGSFQGSLLFSFLHSLPVEMPHDTTHPLQITSGVIQPWSTQITTQQPIHPIPASHPSPNSPNPWANFQIQMCHIRPTSDSTVGEYKLDHLYPLNTKRKNLTEAKLPTLHLCQAVEWLSERILTNTFHIHYVHCVLPHGQTNMLRKFSLPTL